MMRGNWTNTPFLGGEISPFFDKEIWGNFWIFFSIVNSKKNLFFGLNFVKFSITKE
jgi:hypothetical protein